MTPLFDFDGWFRHGLWGPLCLLVFLLGCGGKAEVTEVGSEGTGGATPDGAVDSGVDARPPPEAGQDGPPTEFCEGAAKVERGGELVSTVPTTASDVPMFNCCQSIVIRFHTAAELGADTLAIVRIFGLSFEPGDYEVGSELEARVVSTLPEGWPDQTVEGRVRVLGASGGSEPWELGVCLRVRDAASPLDGTRVYVEGVPVAPYSWTERFTLWALADPSVTAEEAAAQPLDSLTLGSPVLWLSAIDYYRWSTHFVALLPGHSKDGLLDFREVGVSGMPFVVQVDGERVYLGAFMTHLSSYAFPGPVIFTEDISEQGFSILAPSQGVDSREDPRVSAVLSEASKLVQ